ncbi:MAG: hypothetical protein CXT73_04690 [Methanobacteriota archaeon]|nr:MAG: hypothetical protein CXT73_04690 [Euryarchaeota archaeon]
MEKDTRYCRVCERTYASNDYRFHVHPHTDKHENNLKMAELQEENRQLKIERARNVEFVKYYLGIDIQPTHPAHHINFKKTVKRRIKAAKKIQHWYIYYNNRRKAKHPSAKMIKCLIHNDFSLCLDIFKSKRSNFTQIEKSEICTTFRGLFANNFYIYRRKRSCANPCAMFLESRGIVWPTKKYWEKNFCGGSRCCSKPEYFIYWVRNLI